MAWAAFPRCVGPPCDGAAEQPDVVVVVDADPGSAAGSPTGSSVDAGSAPVARPLPSHGVLHFDATHVAIALRAAFVAHSAAASFVFRHT